MIIIISLISLILLTAPANASYIPTKGDYFNYNINEYINNGLGEYEGYSERTVGDGHYEIERIDANNITVKYNWKWHYTSDTEPSASGSRDDRIVFDATNRTYISGFDLDEPADYPRTTWFWINPDVKVGDIVRILDKPFTVTNTRATIWTNWMPKVGIELTYGSIFNRNDAYGVYTATYTDKYYMDIDTGYIIAERYFEHDSGAYQGRYAAFDWIFEFDVTETSYNAHLDYLELSYWYFFVPGMILLIIIGICYAARWASRTIYMDGSFDTKAKRIYRRKSIPSLPPGISKHFDPFIEDMMRKALAAGDRVAVVTKKKSVVAVGIYHKDAKIGTIFADRVVEAETLRKYLGMKDFFSECNYKPVKTDEYSSSSYNKFKDQDVYNIHETYKIMSLGRIDSTSYDHALIRTMKPEDIPSVCALSKKVYKIRAKRWFKTLLRIGDVGVVAELDGMIVGFAFVTIAGDHARLHSLTVDPSNRGKGIGKELMYARLTMAYHLGATDAMLEIADWNLPSLRIATIAGFTHVGEMYVETVRTKKLKRNIVRR